MPRIQTYESQVRTAGPMDAPEVKAPGGLNKGLAAIGEGLSRVGQGLDDYEQRKSDFEAQKVMADAHLEWLKKFEDAKQNSDQYTDKEGKPNFLQSFNDEFDSWHDKTLEEHPSANSQALQLNLARLKTSLTEDAYKIEAGIYARKQKEFLDTKLNDFQNLARANPSKVSELSQTASELVSSTPFQSDKDKSYYAQVVSQKIHDSALDGRVSALASSINATPEMAKRMIAELKDQKSGWGTKTSAQVYDQSLSKLERLSESLTEKRNQFYVSDFKEKMAQLEKEGRYYGEEKGMYSPAWIQSNIPAGPQREEMLRLEERSRAVGTAYQSVKQKPFTATEQELISERQTLGTTPSYTKDSAAFQAKLTAYERAKKEFRENPSEYVMTTSPLVSENRKVFDQNPTAENAQKYAEETISEQKRIDPTTLPSILTTSDIGRFKNTMAAIGTDPNGVDTSHKFLQEQAKLWGKNWPVVVQDLKRNKAINDSQYVVANMLHKEESMPLARDMLRASTVKVQELEAQLPTPAASKKNANEAAAKALSDFKRTLIGVGEEDRTEAYASYHNAITNYMLYREAWPDSKATANPTEIANQLILNEFDFKGTYRVPKNEHADEVERGTDVVRLNPSRFKFVPPPSRFGLKSEDEAKIYSKRLATSGYFVTDGENKGLRFFDEFGGEVMMEKDGKTVPARFSWDELRSLAAGSKRAGYQMTPAGEKL